MISILVLAIGLGQATTGDVTMTGRITDAITHQPIAGVRVTYCCTPVTGETDSSGSFLLHVHPAFPESRFTIAKEGYVTVQKRVPGNPGNRDFELVASAHLSGRLVDEVSGEPLAGFWVDAQYRGSPPRLHMARSGKDGSFAFSGEMAPGNYIVRARSPEEYRFTEGRVKEGANPGWGYGVTFFPGVPSGDAAAPVVISPGENRQIRIPLTKRERFYVAGTIELPEGRETDRLNIRLIRNGGNVADSEEKFKAGPFHIDGLAPGSYLLSLTTRTGAAVNQPLEVTNRNIDDLKIALRPAAAIRATVTVVEDKTAPPEHISFRAVPVQPGMPADPSDSLYIRGLPPGQYWPVLSVSAGYAVTSVTYGGQPVSNTPILIEAEESTVRFTVTSRPAAITGVVRDANQKPVPDAVVLVSPYPVPAQIDSLSERRFRTSSGANGTFRIADLAPGSYIVRSGDGDGQKVDLDFGQTGNADLQVK